MLRGFTVLMAVLTLGTVAGQHSGHVPGEDCPMKAGPTASDSPYTGLERREIKALSAEDLEHLLAGHGMGMALAAELNRYPGPKHVLELANSLDLAGDQRLRTHAIFEEMETAAQRLGQRVIELEIDLDGRFGRGEMDDDELRRVVTEIGRVRGELRFTHLRAHLQMRELMSADQIEDYDRLRGYRP